MNENHSGPAAGTRSRTNSGKIGTRKQLQPALNQKLVSLFLYTKTKGVGKCESDMEGNKKKNRKERNYVKEVLVGMCIKLQ